MYRTRRSVAVLNSSIADNLTPITTRRKSINSAGPTANKVLPIPATPKTPLVLSQEPKTPTQVPAKEMPQTKYADPVMARIQRDLNSPSAGARVRANKALKSPGFRKAAYQQFDVPHERMDLITEEERQPQRLKTVQEVFAGCKIYVEVRTGDDNRSEGIKTRLLRDGITVNEKLFKDTTHVIFKDGLLSSYKNAIRMGIPVTTILWIDACVAQRRLVETEKFKISNLDRYEHPELYKRFRRLKSMQPDISKFPRTPTLNKSLSQDDPRAAANVTIGMELTFQDEKTIREAPMEVEQVASVLDKFRGTHRRLTTFTPTAMEQTREATEESTPTSSSNKTIIFNSHNRIGVNSRRSVFDISMNILEMNCKSLGKKKEETEAVVEKTLTPHVFEATQVKTGGQVRKRKLFTNDEFEEYKENLEETLKDTLEKSSKKQKEEETSHKSRKSLVMRTAAKKPKEKEKTQRRETISYFKTKEMTMTKGKSPAKPAAMKFIVCTNMSASDKQIISAAILKLGGRIESEVTTKTTHVVSPNEERTMNILRGVIRACLIVNVSWIHDSMAQNKWLDTTIYQHNICDNNRVHERSVLGPKVYVNSTFSLYGPFYLSNAIDNHKKVDYLREVITLCGGSITETVEKAKVIVSDQPVKDSKQIVVMSTHIFDSAMKGTFLEPIKYVPRQKKD